MSQQEIIFIGIDPGLKGGICILSSLNTTAKVWDVKDTTRKSMAYILSQAKNHQVVVVGIEDVKTIMVASKSSNFKLGNDKGIYEGILIGNKIGYTLVGAKTWQKHFSMSRKKSETTNSWKKRLLEKAEQKLPELDLNLNTCDAALIALYLKETYNL